ncbi:hypothetical protein C4544_04635, partial [candidate division WS5 bacterium]
KHGWAKNLPTWRPKDSNIFTRSYSQMMSGKEITGYHLSIFAFVFLLFGLPYVFGYPLTLINFLMTASFYFMFCILWDFLWFVLNPHYPLKQFKKEHLAFHHKKWFLGIPTDYWGGLFVSLLVLLPIATQTSGILWWWGINISLFAVQTFLIALFSLFILKIDKWHTS